MNAAALSLDLMALGLALAVVARRVALYRRLRIDHVLLFSVGHAYYFSLAGIMAKLNILSGTYGFVYGYFDRVTPERQVWVSLWGLLLLMAFLLGSAAYRRPLVVEPQPVRSPSAQALVAPAVTMLVAALGGFVLTAVLYRSVILEGYRSLDPQLIQEQTGRGVLSAAASATILSALFLLDVVRRATGRVKSPGIVLLVVFSMFVPSATLLLAGGRMYVATLLVALLVWRTHVRRPVQRKVLIAGALFGFVALTSLGSLRTGAVPDRNTVGFYATSESVLDGISKGRFLTSKREIFLPLRVPKYLLSDLTNIVPRAVLPGKDDLRFDPEDDGFLNVSSLGATHLTVSAMINFGFVGSLLAFGALANVLARLRHKILRRPTIVWSISYACASAALTFSIFRDPFSISVARWMLVNAIVLPGVYLAAVKLVRRSEPVRPLKWRTAQQTPS